ncbi:MAG: hypothetical protein GXP35_10530 [Actinobacteria bacterium]|nr:hypothetical protein [Actinomycetota bacterium]
MLALFEATETHPMIPQQTGIAFNFADPWGNQYELNCYEYDRIKADLVEADGLDPTRYWPPGLRPQE